MGRLEPITSPPSGLSVMGDDRPPSDTPDDALLIRDLRAAARGGRGASPPDHPIGPPDLRGYEIIREIHRGGQGVVYQALQRSTKRKVAIKVLLESGHASASARKRFEREIELVAQLKHPSIISIFDSGETSDGRQYYVMDYIRGLPLDRAVAEGKYPLRRALALFRGVCEAVQYAHQRGVLHRDLKPSNIVVDSEGNPKILDFGLAKPLSNPVETLVSVSRQLVGTVAYMSPEQVAGNPDGVDVRTDVYSLGVMLYEMLTGGFPYPVDGPWTETIRHITDTEPAAPHASKAWVVGTAGLRRLDRDLQTVVLKALAKEKERRYQSAGEFARDIDHYLSDEPIEARRDSSWYLIRKVVRRKRWHLVVGVFFLALVVSLLSLRSRSRELDRTRALAVVHGDWSGEDPDTAAETVYGAFFARLAAGNTTPEEREAFFSHAFAATLRARRFYGLDGRIAAIVELYRRIDLEAHGLTSLVTVTLSMNEQTFARGLRMPLSRDKLRFTRQSDRDAAPLRFDPPVAADLIAEVVFEVHWTSNVPERLRRIPGNPDEWAPADTLWREVRPLRHRVNLFGSLPESYPTAVVDAATAARVEAGFVARRVLVDEQELSFEFSYNGTMPLAGGIAVKAPGGEDLLPPTKFSPSGVPGESPFYAEIILPPGFLDGVRDGSIATVRVVMTPKRGVALLVPDLEFYYGLPIERAVPVFIREAEDAP